MLTFDVILLNTACREFKVKLKVQDPEKDSQVSVLQRCNHCGKMPSLRDGLLERWKRCSVCRAVRYCSYACCKAQYASHYEFCHEPSTLASTARYTGWSNHRGRNLWDIQDGVDVFGHNAL